MIKISASLTVQYDNIFSPFLGSEWRKGMAWAKGCGFDGIELIITDPNLLDPDEILFEAQANSLVISTISTGQAMGMEALSLVSAKQYIREATQARLRDDIDFSVRLGRPNVTIGLIRGRGGEHPSYVEKNLLLRELSRLIDYAAKRGIVLNLEPINRYEVCWINSTDEGYELLQKLGMPENCGLLYDTFHSNIEDADMRNAILRNHKKITHVHFADSNRRLPGEGHIDFDLILKTLNEVDYNGFISLEVLNLPSAEHIQKNAAKCFHNIIKYKAGV
ncbi:MAG TPA: sugar phosphate isomerase/epimerase [Clostridiaceae bacterium]|jgi:sugar phosphate isomerase/epimerase|nr:sugar phosphate isomerase/epimerase [Clostridiaceae bacterium]